MPNWNLLEADLRGSVIPSDIRDRACVLRTLQELLADPTFAPADLCDTIRQGNGFPLTDLWLLEECAPVKCWPDGEFSLFDCKRGGYYLLEPTMHTGGYRSRLLGPDDQIAVVTWEPGEDHAHMKCITVAEWPRVQATAIYLITRRRAGGRF